MLRGATASSQSALARSGLDAPQIKGGWIKTDHDDQHSLSPDPIYRRHLWNDDTYARQTKSDTWTVDNRWWIIIRRAIDQWWRWIIPSIPITVPIAMPIVALSPLRVRRCDQCAEGNNGRDRKTYCWSCVFAIFPADHSNILCLSDVTPYNVTYLVD